MRRCILSLLALCLLTPAAPALESPWVSDVYFYWYTWDSQRQWGGWQGGVYNTPLLGYYDSPSYEANLRELHLASEWGLTHHFMDYWGPGWKGTDGGPREAVLMRAIEAVRAQGYPVWMSVYQDGTDFDMADFPRNLDAGRDARFYFDLCGKSEAFPKVDGKPLVLIYGRNGRPATSATDDGFRAWLQQRYADLAELNRQWGTSYAAWNEIQLDYGSGCPRYESIKYQYEVWQGLWQQTNAAAKQQYGWPGILCSWDVGYQPLRGWGFSDQPKVFVGPHSYGGIFGVPHDQRTERFIQAQVAKAYGSVFFDSFKNFYHDWEIRIPGTCYPPDFNAFDRFWVTALQNRSEALLHLSWNEWWEGSNLEPCLEYGKAYCEKNLLWSSVMHQCFPSIRDWNQGAKVAILLNDWSWYTAARGEQDIYGCIEALRRSGVTFDLLPDDFVTTEKLARFETVIAPSAGAGFGFNAQRQAILPLLQSWVKADPNRHLVLSKLPPTDPASKLVTTDWLKLQPVPTAAAAKGGEQNVVVDVGTADDAAFMLSGYSGREEWGHLPPGAFGARDGKHTVRWTPGEGTRTTLLLPVSPGRDHVLRIGGDAIVANQVTLSLGGQPVGTLELQPGYHEYELNVPAKFATQATAELRLDYAKAVVPSEVDPQKYHDERHCNLALEYVQLATAGTAKDAPVKYEAPVNRFSTTAEFPGEKLESELPYASHDAVTGGTVLSRFDSGAARDLLASQQIWYCNGLLGTVPQASYFDTILNWAGARAEVTITGDGVTGTTLSAGDTKVMLAYNLDAPEPRSVSIRSVPGELPISEVQVLSKDGVRLPAIVPGKPGAPGELKLDDTVTWYGAYQVTYAPIRVDTPPLRVAPGQEKSYPIQLTNLTDQPVSGSLGQGWGLPSLELPEIRFDLKPNESDTFNLTLVARGDLDWGGKSIVLELTTNGRQAYLWRNLDVLKPSEARVVESVVDAGTGTVIVAAELSSDAASEPLRGVKLRVAGRELALTEGTNGLWQTKLDGLPALDQPELRLLPATLLWHRGTGQVEQPVELPVGLRAKSHPKLAGARSVVVVYNPHERYLENQPVRLDLGDRNPAQVHLRDAAGAPVPCGPAATHQPQLEAELLLPPRSATRYYLCDGAPPPAADLVVEQRKLGTGKGLLAVRNSAYAVTFSEAAGGTIVALRKSGETTDHAAPNLGGISAGRWGTYDPRHPRIDSNQYVGQEQRIRQCEHPGTITVNRLPNAVVVEVTWDHEGLTARQIYRIPAYRPVLEYASSAEVDEQADGYELVVADLSFQRGAVTKIYPNFTGIAGGFEGDQPHAGWREGPLVPDVSCLLTPPTFESSLSAILIAEGNVTRFRQGFWPASRPKPGPVTEARLEYARPGGGAAAIRLDLLFHQGHQPAAEAYRNALLDHPPRAVVEQQPIWSEVTNQPVDRGADWWHAGWAHRLKLAIDAPADDTTDPLVTAQVDLSDRAGGRLEPNSPRVVVDGWVVPSRLEVVHRSVSFVLPGQWPAGRTIEAWLYYDTTDHDPKPPATGAAKVGPRLANAGFEAGGQGWALPGPLCREQPHEGKLCARLTRDGHEGPVVLSTGSMRITPETRYRLTCWARTSSPEAVLRTNLYADATYDFPQLALPVPSDGQWHQLTAELKAGAFPPDVRPVLRFWVLGGAVTIDLDEVALVPVDGKLVGLTARVVD